MFKRKHLTKWFLFLVCLAGYAAGWFYPQSYAQRAVDDQRLPRLVPGSVSGADSEHAAGNQIFASQLSNDPRPLVTVV